MLHLTGLYRCAAVATLALAGSLSTVAATLPPADGPSPTQPEPLLARAGAALYRDGQLANGQALVGRRGDGTVVAAREAACVGCHRASGMGGAEGAVAIPAIQASVLMAPGRRPGGAQGRINPAMRRAVPGSQTRAAYTADSLRLTLASGRRADGSTLGELMPRYELSAADIEALLAHLHTLRSDAAPGIVDGVVHLATVIDADAPLEQRLAVESILSDCLEQTAASAPAAVAPGEGGARRWQWHRWPVSGPPQTWPAQLTAHQQRQPVFALVSGLSNRAWQPVQDHCEQQRMPCLLPNAPGVDPARPGAWSFHFTRGVALEAALIDADLRAQDGTAAGAHRQARLVQWHDFSEAAQLGVQVLGQRWGPALDNGLTLGVPLDHGHITPAGLRNLRKSMAQLRSGDHLVLWLASAPLEALTRALPPPPVGVSVHLSGELADVDVVQVSPAWRRVTGITSTHDAPARRVARQMLNASSALTDAGGPLTPILVRLQANSFSACQMATRALRMMGSKASRTWLLELFEASDEAALATSYPRFTLGPNQRVGSRGGWVLRPDPLDPQRLKPVAAWQVPDFSDVADAQP